MPLLTVEKALLHRETLNVSAQDILDTAKHDLAEKIAEYMISKELIKFEIKEKVTDSFGEFVAVKGSVRAYHPDN